MKQKATKNYFFTKNWVATEEEKNQASKLKCILVNGVFGSSFNKPMISAFGNVPDHLTEKVNKVEQAKVVKALNAEQEKAEASKPKAKLTELELLKEKSEESVKLLTEQGDADKAEIEKLKEALKAKPATETKAAK